MSEKVRNVEIDDSFTVLDEINELADEVLDKDDTVENVEVTEVYVKIEDVDNFEKNDEENLEAAQENDPTEQCDPGMCEEDNEEHQVSKGDDDSEETSVNDKSVAETCDVEQSDDIAEESAIENKDETVEQAEVSVNLNETGSLRDTDLSECVDEEEPEKVEADVTHPYLYIIETFEYEKDQLNLTTVGSVKTLAETPFHMITTKAGLVKMLQNLRNVKEIGLDVERTAREYAGTICLILISTRDADYCIDAIRLQHDLLLLTEIFINPKILKIVLRGRSTLACLQQNLHLYLINIFDIQQARVALMAGEGNNWTINNILKIEYNFDRGQLKNPDLRKRPLPEAYKTFYRAGPHYFIYIYHDYKNRLILKDAELYKKILDDCRNMCKVTFGDMDSMSYESLESELKNYHKCELELLKNIYDWRSSVAQKKNVKCDSVLYKGGVLNLVRQLPTQDEEIFSCANSPHVKENVEKIKDLINDMKIKYNIRRKRIRNKKGTLNAPIFQEPPMQGNIQQKRKFVDHTEIKSKQKRVEQLHDTFKAYLQNHPMKKRQNEKFVYNPNKQKQSPQNKNTKNSKQNSPYQNKNVQPWVDKRKGSFFNNNEPFNTSSTGKRKRFQPPENRYTEAFNIPVNEGNEMSQVFLNPTTVPSSFTFDTNSSPRNNVGSSTNEFDRPMHQNSMMQMSLGNFGQSSRRHTSNQEDEQETLYRSLVDLKQTRDNIRMQGGNYAGNFKPPRYQDLNAIDQKINNLERRIQQTQSRNRFGGNATNNDPLYTRRY